LKGYTLDDKENSTLKQEIRQFIDSTRENEIFYSETFYRYIYEQAQRDGVFDRKHSDGSDCQWGEDHAAHKVDRFLSAYERYKIIHLNN
jgi:hypothetical protein